MATWIASHSDEDPERGPDAEPELEEQPNDEVVVSLPARRLRLWLGGMFGRSDRLPEDPPPPGPS